MRVLPNELLDELRTGFDPSRWPGVLASEDGGVLRARFEAAVLDVGGPISPTLVEWTSNPARPPGTVRAALWALGLARLGGHRPVGVAPPFLRMEAPDGAPWLLIALPFDVPRSRVGSDAAVASLVDALRVALPGRRYGLHLRTPLPDDFDPMPVANAASLWLRAIRRGEWRGTQAVYDDGPVAMAIDLLGDSEGPEGCLFVVGAPRAPEWLASIDTALMDALAEREEGMAVIGAACADPRWALPRESVTQYLLGTPSRVDAEGPLDASYTGTFSRRGVSMFSDSLCADLAAVWLVDQAGADPLAASSRAWVNPWCGRAVPAQVGLRLAPAGPVDLDRSVLSWIGGAPARWSAA